MRTILFLVQKEFLQIRRDKFLGKAILIIPVVQMVILVYAATLEIKSIKVHFVDQDKSSESVDLIQKISAAPFFLPVSVSDNVNEGNQLLLSNKADMVCLIPDNFGKDINSGQQAEVQLLLNSINASAAQISFAYCSSVIRSYSSSIAATKAYFTTPPATIDMQTRHWYNPELNYKIYMAPGILVILVTVIGWLLAGMNIVKEKEQGTIEQLNVTPIKKYQFVLGKLIPFLLIGLFDLAFGLTIAWILFKVPVEGSLIVLFSFATIYLLAVLAIGLLISTISNTQQQVLFFSFFFVIVFVMMSGLFTSAENMPVWGQRLNLINPLSYFIKVVRMVLLKGSGFADILPEITAISIFAIVMNGLAIWRYRKTV
jgi:ABC-2 type transport system permease protein